MRQDAPRITEARSGSVGCDATAVLEAVYSRMDDHLPMLSRPERRAEGQGFNIRTPPVLADACNADSLVFKMLNPQVPGEMVERLGAADGIDAEPVLADTR